MIPVEHKALIHFLSNADDNCLVTICNDRYYHKYVLPYLLEVSSFSSDIKFNITEKCMQIKGHKGKMYFKIPNKDRWLEGISYKTFFIDETDIIKPKVMEMLRAHKR